VGLILRFGYAKNKHLYKIDTVQIVFIYTVVYLMLTYLLGIVIGFVRTPYSLEFIRIIQNIFPVIVVIILQELVRYAVITKGKKHNIMLITLFLMTMPIAMNIGAYNLRYGTEIFEFIGLLVIPSIVNNLLLTYIVIKVGYKPAILYRLVLALPIFLIPILPNLGIYLESVFGVLLPTALFLKLNTFYGKTEYLVPKSANFARRVSLVSLVFVAILLVGLTSGLFKSYALAIGSNSMYPAINRGDAIIVTKLTEEDKEMLDIGDVIVYLHEGRRVIHRIVGVAQEGRNYVFHTKGDNNELEDDYFVRKNQIEGIVRARIMFVGFPSVWLSE
jgi:signal peptidase